MAQTKRRLPHIFLFDFFHNLNKMGSNTPHELSNRVVSRGRDAGLFEDLATHVGVGDTKQKLLLLRALSRW